MPNNPNSTTKDLRQYFHRASAADFRKIPGSPIAYWASKSIFEVFQNNCTLSSEIETREGLTTGSNDLFLRLWYEVDWSNIGYGIKDTIAAKESNKRYFAYIKGGEFRRWSGNFIYVVNWYNDGVELKNFKDLKTGRIRSHNYNGDYAFKTGFTWSGISSGLFAVRHVPSGFMFDAKGPMGFSKNSNNQAVHEAFLNSTVTYDLIKMLAPTLDFKLGHVLNLPIVDYDFTDVVEICNSAVYLSKADWDAYETSWDFQQLPLLLPEHREETLEATYRKLREHWRDMTQEMQRLEEENNRIFIEAYGLAEELTPEVPLEEITLTCNPQYRYGGRRSAEELETRLWEDTMKELISYAVGCMMGRYSLDTPGLVYADSGNVGFDPSRYESFPADDDGIIPITAYPWFDDDCLHRFEAFLRVAFGPQALEENLAHVASALGPRASEGPRDTIRRYLAVNFFKDHLQTYKKRPIYWLFSSGRQRAFQCLVYLHRYNAGTLARMRTEYVIPLMGKLSARLDHLKQDLEQAQSTAQTRRIEREQQDFAAHLEELRRFDETLRHYADLRIELDLDDGVKQNYGKFGELLAEVRAVTGQPPQSLDASAR